jgi:hypothetical protein
MPLVFTDNFWSEDNRNLRRPDLACLRQDADTYDILLLQIKDKIEYDNSGIWIADRQKALSKFRSFLNVAIYNNIELAATPEYSCPWEAIDEFLIQNKFPTRNNLWVLGCQSIRPQQLKDFISAHNQVTWILDNALLEQSIQQAPDKFFDPACLIFNTTNNAGAEIKIIIVQFKAKYFGGDGFEWERDGMIKGNTFYVLSNIFASTKLIVLICSDTLQQNLDFNAISDGFFLNDPLLILHIQLNQKPFQTNYKSYRNLLFSLGDKNYKKEILCLNWARGVETDGVNPWNKYGGSGFYIKSNKLNLTDIRINQNHLRGIYYTRHDNNKSHIYFLNYDEYVFLVRTTKPSQDAADPTQHSRTGPEIIRSFHWHSPNWEECSQVTDDFHDLCREIENELGDLSCLKDSKLYIDVERIVELSLGKLSLEKEWYRPAVLKSFHIKDDEINNRLNFAQDPTMEIRQSREEKLEKYAYLKHNILTNADNLPQSLKKVDLKYENLSNLGDRYLLNLHSKTDHHKGTGIFLDVSRPSRAKAIRDSVASLFTETNRRRNVVVWYLFNGILATEVDQSSAPQITDNVSKPVPSYKRTRE